MEVNGRPLDDFFPSEVLKMVIKQPLQLTETAEKFDIFARSSGGGSRPGRAPSATASPAPCSSTTASSATGSSRPAS
jgi:ribosomal protein S9